ncbi:MAG TPA: pyridoxamine 5'-phosphate oxidase family protein [Nitrososphaerales archaeon]|nr:pyridoxamine 5'-phosphate oxidase family protein [Nitrososphaerales archaeon]
MVTWGEFEKSSPEMARFGAQRMSERVMYIGTVRKDGYPRVHPFTPFLSAGRLFAFMYPTSPKAHDLLRDGRYVIHSLVKDWNGSDGEFMITGRAISVEDQETLAVAAAGCPYTPSGKYVCFEFLVEECMTNHYVDGKPQLVRWKDPSLGSKR